MALKDMMVPSQTQVKKDDNLAGAARSMLFNNKKNNASNTTVTGLENPTGWGVKKNVMKTSADNPTNQAARTMVKNNPVNGSNGQMGVRKALVGMGYDNSKIGYNSNTGNVTYDGHDILKPGRVENGTSYASEGDVLAAAQVIANNGGQAPVKVVDYMNGKAPNVPVNWNHETAQLNIGGVPVNAPTFGGSAYMTADAADAAAQQYYDNTGIQSDVALAQKYGQQNNATADVYRRLAEEKFNYNPNTDAATQALQKMYSDKARQAMRDVAGQYGTMNGGHLTSGGLEAVASARADYDNQFLSQIPTLQQNAYNQFVNEQQRQQGLAGATNDLNNQNYQMEYNANRNTIADGQANADRQRVQRYEDIQYAFANAKARGFFTPEEALVVGVPEEASPYDADIKYLEMQNNANLDYYKQQLNAQNEAELALIGAQIAKGYKKIGGGSGGSSSTGSTQTTDRSKFNKNVKVFADYFNDYYNNKGKSNNTGGSKGAYEGRNGSTGSETTAFMYQNAAGDWRVVKGYENKFLYALERNDNLSDEEKATLKAEIGLQ